MKLLFIGRMATAVVAAATLFITCPTFAEISFKDKIVQVIVASDPGGGTDRMGRLLGQYIEKYLPGRPAVIIKNTDFWRADRRARNGYRKRFRL